MRRLFRGRPVFRWLALVVAFFAVLGHVCVLPHGAHAVAAESPENDNSHEHSQHDALHAASCEAVPSNATPATSVSQAATSVAVLTLADSAGSIHRPRPPALAASPPLFLLHSALRI